MNAPRRKVVGYRPRPMSIGQGYFVRLSCGHTCSVTGKMDKPPKACACRVCPDPELYERTRVKYGLPVVKVLEGEGLTEKS